MIGHRSDGRNEHGYVAILAALMFATFAFGCAALGVDVARMFVEVQRVQKAADAGALSGVTYLPDLSAATDSAIETSMQNGYPNSGTSSVTVVLGKQASQLKVTVCSTIKNSFGAAIGVGTAKICRSAVSDFTGPQPMGNPCNTLGNEPAGSPGAGPAASQLQKPVGANCSSTPQFWMTIAGPKAYKTQGDKYSTRFCQGVTPYESGCIGSNHGTNDDFDPGGYVMLVRVDKAGVGKTYTVQLYDPAYIPTGPLCTAAPTGTFPTSTTTGPGRVTVNDWNDYATTDAATRYHVTTTNSNGQNTETPNSFCSGDADNSGHRAGSSASPTITSFGLRAPVASRNPLDAPPVTNCTKQYPGYDPITVGELSRDNGSYDANQAAVFHEWNTLCTFTATVAGDYYLQVRTDVAMQSNTLNDPGGYKPVTASSSPMYTSNDDDTSVTGNGTNMYAVRVFGGSVGNVSVAAYGRLPIYANANSATPQFNLIRVLPAAAGKTLVFKFFDVGDAASSPGATLTVLPPPDATGTNITGSGSNKVINGCSASGYQTYTASQMTNCSISNIYAPSPGNWNGQEETIAVPIPSNYTCTNDSTTVNGGGCWFQVSMNFSSTSVTDVTTWTADISGAPVRLVE